MGSSAEWIATVALLIKYWRYFAMIGAILALFAYHKWECSKCYQEGRDDMAAEVRDQTEAIRRSAQEAIAKAEAEALAALELKEVEIRVVDREVVKTVIPDCPDAFDVYLRLRNQYARALSGGDGAGVDNEPLPGPGRE